MHTPSPIDRAKAAMGYQPPSQRPRCASCYHVQYVAQPTGAANDMHAWRCTKGGFGVLAGSVCGQHQIYQRGGAA